MTRKFLLPQSESPLTIPLPSLLVPTPYTKGGGRGGGGGEGSRLETFLANSHIIAHFKSIIFV